VGLITKDRAAVGCFAFKLSYGCVPTSTCVRVCVCVCVCGGGGCLTTKNRLSSGFLVVSNCCVCGCDYSERKPGVCC
jgi:hypothetical protein